ncbi:MAG: tRNA preQ1(34) S-adenosylmethionine ribosyltransferase-isomerase QueA [Desulfobulbaceae bacterium]|nr:tRNA preQ1(34) S-adenosylmethionine ribosyltransferase-isomerase QueA [Desulfobulbaceae bacterium]
MNSDFNLTAYDYELPPEHIAQQPTEHRDQSRLLVLENENNKLVHTRFASILDYLRPGDLLVRNNTRVFPARLIGQKETGGRIEMLLLEYPGNGIRKSPHSAWYSVQSLVLVKSSKRPRVGSTLFFCEDMEAKVLQLREDGKVEIEFCYRPGTDRSLDDLLARHGQIPLPPYIRRPQGTTDSDSRRYQTRYAEETGSVAAPTAGLHFSDSLLKKIQQKGVESCAITLHVGYGTFAPVRCENIMEHRLHREYVEVSAETAEKINLAKAANRRIWAVGTTTVRTLEFAADKSGRVQPTAEPCGLFIYPGFRFQIVDNLITNFHLPQSSLLFLVAALVGRERLLDSYREAVTQGYRFFSYGDAMAIIQK